MRGTTGDAVHPHERGTAARGHLPDGRPGGIATRGGGGRGQVRGHAQTQLPGAVSHNTRVSCLNRSGYLFG